MNYKSVVDISAIIWNPEDYENNTSEYYKLRDGIINLLDYFKREKPFIVLRHELLSELINGFPYNKMPNSFYSFGNVVYDFLTSIPQANRVVFVGANSEIISIPDIVKKYFNANTQLEANYQITYLHTEREISNKYFTFQYLHGSEDELVTSSNANSEGQITTETIFADDASGLENFFKKYRRIFEHSPKHTSGHEHGDDASPLSCFTDNDPTTAQKYLEAGVRDGKRYYNFDLENDVYVVFMPTQDNFYHGYDEADRNRVPAAIRRRFNK